jgi:hypothetical protein
MDPDRHLDAVMDLAGRTARHHRCRQRYPRAFHEGLARLAQTDPRIVWRYCAHDGRPVATQIYVIECGVLQAWQSYFDRSFSFLKPNQAMRLEVCRGFAARGGTRFNLGSTPPAAAGLAAYKRRWGGRRIEYPGYAWNAIAGVGARVAATLSPSRATLRPVPGARVP